MDNEKISLGVNFANENLIFHLRMISLNEEQELRQRYAEILPDDVGKEQKYYRVIIDALKEFSVDYPQKYERDKKVLLVEGAKSPAAAIEDYFGEMTIAKERLANGLFLSYRERMQPTVIFLA